MVKRKGAKRNVKKPAEKPASPCSNVDEHETEKQRQNYVHEEVTRRITASKAIRDVEVGHLLTGLRLLRSNFNKEQLQVSFLRFLEENMQNLTVKINEEDGQFEVNWKDKDGNLSVSHVDKTNLHESLLQKISKACPDFAAAGMSSFAGCEFSSKTVNTADLLRATDFQIPDFVMQDPSESQNMGLQNAFHTPGANSQRLSVGMTPKTLRLPKPGEMLLSVRGSPLGVYNKDDNMEAIDEAEEG